MKLSDYVVDFFERQGLTDVFMVSGGGCMHLVNSFGSSKKIKYWCTQHEQAAAMAAESYSKIKNGVGLVLVTSGPGATNTVTGVLDCYQDSTPVVFLSGQAKSKQTTNVAGIPGLRQFGVQEANIVPIVQSITKMAVEITDPNTIRYYLERAIYEAKSDRPGPVWISLPLDVQSANINPAELPGYTAPKRMSDSAINEKIENVYEKLCHSQRPVIIAGHGIRLAGACDLFSEAVRRFGIPVVMPIMGIDVLENDHPCNIGRIGTKGTRAGNFAMQNADLILSIGSRLSVSSVGHEYDLFAREATVIAVDIDPQEHLKKTICIDNLLECDAKVFIEKCLQKGPVSASYKNWLTCCQTWKEKYPVVLEAYNDDSKGINYYKFIDMLNDAMTADMPVIADAGSAFYVTAQAIKLRAGQRYITTGATATMGFSVPAAVGVAAAQPDSSVIAITGEGSFMQNMQELEVLRYHNMNAKIFVMSNGGYFSIHQTQKKFFQGNFVGESTNSGISFTDVKKLANAFDIKFYRIDSIKDGQRVLHDILVEQGPAVIDVKINPDMEIIPTNASAMREDGMMISKPLEDMYPFLDRAEFKKEMIIEPYNLE